MNPRLEVDVVTIFPGMFGGVLGESILGRAVQAGILRVNLLDLRDFTHDRHRRVDDYPFGGGPGMVMKPEPFFEAVETVREHRPECGPVILLSPQGEVFTQDIARQLAVQSHLVLLCGHYEGVDERVRRHMVDRELSLGDYVLTGGELPAMVVIDAVARLLPGVLGAEGAAEEESFSDGLLEYPQYTRPRDFRGWAVPEVLLNGNHAQIARWRRQEALRRTLERRPELLEGGAEGVKPPPEGEK